MPPAHEHHEGFEAAKRWAVDARESERQHLRRILNAGGFRLLLVSDTLPTLISVLRPFRTPETFEVNFAASPWLRGFRAGLVEHLITAS